jgi:hypothetical protein
MPHLLEECPVRWMLAELVRVELLDSLHLIIFIFRALVHPVIVYGPVEGLGREA